MAYTVNDKLYTDNPLLDEIVHNAKVMMNGVVLKDEDEATLNETAESVHDSDIFMSIKKNKTSFEFFNYTVKQIKSVIKIISDRQAIQYSEDRNLIPEQYRDALTELASKDYIDNYVEKNNYYRMLSGLPNYGEKGYFLKESYIEEERKKFFDFTIPIHEYPNSRIALLQELGVLSRIQQENPDLKYLYHLAANKVDLFTARNALPFEAIFIPKAEELVRNRFKEILDTNRIIYTKRHYSLAYKFKSDYYNKVMILMIIAQSVTDLIAETPEWYIRRDIFDARTAEYILTANGVHYYEQIPLKYQVSLIRILNRLIKYKSCNQNIYDLASVFNLDNVHIYKYYLMKERKVDKDTQEYINKFIEVIEDPTQPDNVTIKEDVENMYELLFVRTSIDDSYDNYINDNINKTDYEIMVYNDPWWDGTEDHDKVKHEILEKEFTILPTKYLSFETVYSIADYQFQIQYMLNLILNNNLNLEALTFQVPIINESSSFEIRDIFILLYVLSFNYYDHPTNDIIICDNRDNIYEKIEPDIEEEGLNGGRTYHHYPPFENANGFHSKNVIDDSEDAEDYPIIKGEDFEGSVSFGFDQYEELDGGTSSDVEYYQVNAGTSKNSYINQKTGTNYYDRPSLDFIEEFDKNKINPVVDLSNRIFGFNIDADLNYLASVIGENHRHFNFVRGYKLDEIIPQPEIGDRIKGIQDFLVPENREIKTSQELLEIYNTNKEIYDNLVECMKNTSIVSNKEEFETYKFVYDYLFTVEVDRSYFMMHDGSMAMTYSEFLSDKDPVLYDFFQLIMLEENTEKRQYNISEYVDSIIESIETFLDNAVNLNNIFYFVPTVNWSTILHYLSLLVNFFKSYKTQFLDIAGTLEFNHNLDNSIDIYDNMSYIDIQLDKDDKFQIEDGANFEIEKTSMDLIDLDDKAKIYPEYVPKYYQIDGGKSIDKLFTFDIEGNRFVNVDGRNSENIEYSESIDGHSANVEDMEDEDSYAGSSLTNGDYDFFDLDGASSKDIEKEDYSYEVVEDWNGGASDFRIYTHTMDNGNSKNKLFYADYCEKDNTISIDYNPEKDGDYDCDGVSSNKMTEYKYIANAGSSVSKTTIDVNGNE